LKLKIIKKEKQMAIAINQDALDKLAFCFGRNSAQYNAIVSAAANASFLEEEIKKRSIWVRHMVSIY
jgi:hypothetical protein